MTISVALAVAALGVYLFYLGSSDQRNNELISGIGSALFSLGLVTLISDLFIRSIYTYDLIELVQLQEHVYQVGFVEAALEGRVPWEDIYDARRQYKFLMASPGGWAAREWQSVLDAARKAPVNVAVYLPNPDSPIAMAAGKAMGFDLDEYKTLITQTARNIETSWALGKTRGDIHNGANASIYRVNDVILFSLIQVDDNYAAVLHHSAAHSPSTDGLAIRFNVGPSSLPGWWFEEQWTNLEEKKYGLFWSDRPAPKHQVLGTGGQV